jgi:hypothetical protein
MSDAITGSSSASLQCKYFFKTEQLKDADGQPIGEARKHPDVIGVFQKPSTEYISAIVSGPDSPAKTMVLEAIENIIFMAGRNQINEWREKNPEGTFTTNHFDLDKLTLEAIALLPKKTRGGYAPSDEEIKAFVEDYKAVMLNVVRYDARKVGTHAKNLEAKLTKLRTEKPILEKLQGFLDTWASHTENMEEHAAVFEWFGERITRWMKAEEKDLGDAF